MFENSDGDVINSRHRFVKGLGMGGGGEGARSPMTYAVYRVFAENGVPLRAPCVPVTFHTSTTGIPLWFLVDGGVGWVGRVENSYR